MADNNNIDMMGLLALGKVNSASRNAETAATIASSSADRAEAAAEAADGSAGALIADAFSTSTAYAVGDYVVYSGKLYRFTADHAAGAWAANDVVEVTAGGELADLKSALNGKVDLPETGEDVEITLNNGYYTATGSFISSSNYRCAATDVIGGETLLLTGSGNSSIPAYYFTWDNGYKIILPENTNIEMDNYKVVVPDIATRVRINNAGTNKTIAIKRTAPDTSFDMTEFVIGVQHIGEDVDVLENDIADLNDTAMLKKIATNYTVFDSVDVNTVYAVTLTTLITQSNKVPYNYFTGCIYTTGDNSGNKQQFAVADNGNIYYRVKATDWTKWTRIKYVGYDEATVYTDLNTAKESTEILFDTADSGTGYNHVPVYMFKGAIFNINGTNYAGQIAIEKDGTAYVRSKNETVWGDWIKLARADVVDSLVNEYPILAEFDNITCLGDSLTYGSVYYAAGNNFRQAKKPYPEVLATLTGSNVTSVAQSGIDPVNYVQNLLSTVTAKDNHLCIIYLGTNGGGLTDTIDTDASGTDKSQYDTTTETGAYCYIVKYCLDIGARVLLVKCHAASATTNEVIAKVAEKFSVAVIENQILPIKYRYWLGGTGADSLHYNDFGYAAFAKYLIRQVNQLSATMMIRIFPYPISAT